VKRREFIAGLGAAAWPVVGRAQQPERVRRIGALFMLQRHSRSAGRRFIECSLPAGEAWRAGVACRPPYLLLEDL
jgi:hypothetical protein